jgi:hypothetical protein
LAGSESIQRSNFDEVNTEDGCFVMNEGESTRDMYRQLSALVVTMRDFGSSYADDRWVKRKFINVILLYEETSLNSIKARSNSNQMTSHDVLSETIAMTIARRMRMKLSIVPM